MSNDEYKACCFYWGEEIMAIAVKCSICHSMLKSKKYHSNETINTQVGLQEKLSKAGSTLQSIGCLFVNSICYYTHITVLCNWLLRKEVYYFGSR